MKYFEGKLTDGDKQIRFVGFRGEQRSRLANYKEKEQSVVLADCEVKKGRNCEELEVVP